MKNMDKRQKILIVDDAKLNRDNDWDFADQKVWISFGAEYVF